MIDRATLEKVLLQNFPITITPLDAKDFEHINSLKDNNFGYSYSSFLLYCNGYNKRGENTHNRRGLLFYDNKVCFGLGVFKKDLSEKLPHLHIVAPTGENSIETVKEFVNKVVQIPIFQNISIYIRYLNKSQYKDITKDKNYYSIDVSPWNINAPKEDETYSHRIVKLSDILTLNSNSLNVQTLHDNNSKNTRKKTKYAYNRFCNFLKRNKLNFTTRRFDTRIDRELGEAFIKKFFSYLTEQKGHPILSTFEDYINLLDIPAEKKEIVGIVGNLECNNTKIPVMLFIGEKISKSTLAIYASFSLRDPSILPDSISTTGFSALSQYCYIEYFKILMQEGYVYADLGGSETDDLDNFKKGLGAQRKESYWALYVPQK